MSERQEELEGKLSEAASLARTWRSFMEHPGWELFKSQLEAQQAMRSSVCMLTPISSEYTAFAQEFFKGEYAGIGLALGMPQTQAEEAETQQRILAKQLEVVDVTQVDSRKTRDELAARLEGNAFGE